MNDIILVPEPGVEVWMIEKSIDGVAHWWCRRNMQFGDWDAPDRWTTDPNKAQKYRTKAFAEFVIGDHSNEIFMEGCVATGHIWMD